MASQNADIGELIDRDILALAREDKLAVAVVMQIREGVLIGRQDFQLNAESDDGDEIILESFFTQYYNHQPNLPEDICIPRDLSQTKLLERWLSKMKGSPVRIVAPKKGVKQRLVDLSAANARLLLDELLIQRRTQTERTSKMVTALQDALNLSFAPRTIACFDISNTGETDTVGSCAYFENGRPIKNQYRHFKIKGVAGQDDFSMMREVIGRYFHRIREEKTEPPSLLLVDGGKGQLSATVAELKSLGFKSQPVVALAKRLEEVFLPGRSEPITIPKSSPGLMLLKRIRDEAHRFAITYNRKVRTKRTVKSALDDIKGIGPAKRTALLKAFSSVQGIRKASLEDLTAVKGITEKLARHLHESLNVT
jgi:excinuclease ABC subunit C